MTTPNLWDAQKTVLTGKLITIQSYLKKQEKQQIDNLTLHRKQLGKEEEEKNQNQQKERKHKDQNRHKGKRKERNNSKA